MTTPLEQVKVAITALSNPLETATANQWLVAFERSVDSWTAAEQLLRETDSQCRFFGAKFLYSKIQKDFLQLNESTIPSLVHTMVQHIIRFAGESAVDMKVCRYLCLALAALAVQINQEGIVTQILLWFNPIVSTNPRVLLELLVVLPEECYNRQVDVAADIRDKFAEQLSASVGEVFGFLHLLSDGRNLSADGNGNVATVNAATINVILRCLEKWIDYINFSGSSLAAHPLFLYALECLSRESSFDAATQVVIATMQKFRCREPTILNLVTPRVFALRELWTAQVEQLNEDSDVDDMSVCRSLCRLFTETAESCLEVIRDDNNTALDQLVFQLVQCSQFRYDHSIARIPLIFFMEAENRQLSDFMRTSDKLYERFLPAFIALYDTALSQLALPADVIIGNNPSMADEVADARMDWRNTVIDCCKVLGPTICLQRACMVLQEHLQVIQQRGQQSNPGNGAAANGQIPLSASMGTAVQWSRVESSLFCIQIVVQHAPNENNPLYPQLMSFIGSLPSDLNSLNATVVGLIGGFSQWLSRNDSFLPPMLTQLYSSLQADNLQTSAAAAKAIMRVFIACAGVVTLPFSELHTIMQSMRQSNKLDLESDLLLLEGFCVVVSKLPSPSSKKASFACIVEPIALTLANSISLNPPPTASSVSADIDRLTTCFRYIIMDGTIVAELFAQIQPLLLRVLEVYAGKESICEKVCRCYKHSIRSARRGFIPLLPAMTIHLADQFQKTPLAAFLYAGAICFSDYSREDGGVHVQTLYTMIWSMSTTFFANFKSLQDFERRPDVAEEYFYLIAKAVGFAPAPFLMSTDGSRVLVDAGIIGLSLQHRDAQKGILMFFEKLIQTPNSDELPQSCATCGVQDVASCQAAAKALILQCGAQLVMTLCSSLAGQTHSFALDEDNGCAGDVLWSIKQQCPVEFQGWLVRTVATFSANSQMHAEKMDFVGSVLAANNIREFLRVLSDFSWRCTR